MPVRERREERGRRGERKEGGEREERKGEREEGKGERRDRRGEGVRGGEENSERGQPEGAIHIHRTMNIYHVNTHVYLSCSRPQLSEVEENFVNLLPPDIHWC